MAKQDKLKTDFRVFMAAVWQHINLPEPTPCQRDIANFLQYGPTKVSIQAFRGVGKSFITSAYVLWELYKDPQKKIFVVSASKSRADNFTTFTLQLIKEIEMLKHLRPREDQRASRVEFDVGPAIADQSPSVRSVGITSQLAGSRADIIVGDDIEVPNNSATVEMREKLSERIKEFSAILKPLPEAKIIFLGTPQTEDSLYRKLPETFKTRIWPARVPSKEQMEAYGEDLAPFIRKMAETKPDGAPTDPIRFDEYDLAAREAEYGKGGFALQFMLNTQLSDMEKYPLKIKDLIIMDVDKEQAPMKVNWLPNPDRELKQLPNLAMAGDRFYQFHSASPEVQKYDGSVMYIDPSGRGKDETGYAVVKMLNGFLYLRRCGGLPGGYDTPTLRQICQIAKDEKVNEIQIEPNFGDGMYMELLKPVAAEIWPCRITESERSQAQKEHRIIDAIEPVMARHKLVVDRMVIEDDYRTAQQYEGENKFQKTLIFQMTRICRDKGALRHDDRLDALAGAIYYWTLKIGQNENRGIKEHKDKLLDAELRKFMHHASGGRTPGLSKTGFFSIRGH
jgi:hypothetical protein